MHPAYAMINPPRSGNKPQCTCTQLIVAYTPPHTFLAPSSAPNSSVCVYYGRVPGVC